MDVAEGICFKQSQFLAVDKIEVALFGEKNVQDAEVTVLGSSTFQN